MSINISKEEFEENYYENKLTYKQMGEKFGCSSAWIMKIGRNHNITPRKANPIPINIIGKKFGNILVLSKEKNYVICQCDCGQIVKRNPHELRREGNKMCKNCRTKAISKKNWKGCGDISGDFWYGIQQSSKKRNYEFQISIEQAWELFLEQNKKCALSGYDLQFTRIRRNKNEYITASLDRIDSSKGYIISNVQWIHKSINKMKMDLPQEDFIKWCKLIALFVS